MRSLLLTACMTMPTYAAAYPTPADIYDDILPVIEADPLLSNSDIKICVMGTCETWPALVVFRKGGMPEMVKPKSGFGSGNEPGGGGGGSSASIGGSVGAILDHVGAKVGVGGKMSVDYSHEKKADGSESTHVKVDVTVGAGSAAGAAVSNP